MSINLEGNIYLDEFITAENFLGNSLLASVLDNNEKETLFNRVKEYMQGEGDRRGYKLTLRQGLTSFFMDHKNLIDPNVRPYVEKLRLRNHERVLVNCSCNNTAVQNVQRPQLDTSYRDHRYFMILDEHREVSEEEAKRDFDRSFIDLWATLFRGIYDAAICPKGYNCSRSEEHLVKFLELLDRIPIISEQEWMESVHGAYLYSD